MSIKADKWIKRMCVPPTHVIEHPDGALEYFYPSCDAEISVANMGSGGVVRVATPADVAEWQPMIEPFAAQQVRAVGGMRMPTEAEIAEDLKTSTHSHMRDSERKLISYGVSSYGYDVRCADEFKIFTNVNSAVVDPKNFDDGCYVDKKAEDGYIIIPPNGFALARTVEYFRIPRGQLVVCLGKSTYARCGIIVNVTPLEPEWEGHVTLEFSNTTSLPAKIYANEGCAQFLFLGSDEMCEVSYKDRGGKYQGQRGVTLPKA